MPTYRTSIEIELEFDYTVVSSGHPGVFSGPPENCEPPESPELVIDEVRLVRRAPPIRQMGADGRVRTIEGRVLSSTALLLPPHVVEQLEAELLENWDDEADGPDPTESER